LTPLAELKNASSEDDGKHMGSWRKQEGSKKETGSKKKEAGKKHVGRIYEEGKEAEIGK
tara:strand:- start:9 stop:185 length:177 start_codon:yes stop_codon:yes gene_type:complete